MAVDHSPPNYPQIAEHLLDWYDRNARILPWRSPPGANRASPYRVWLSEIMLQQTTVAAVIPYYQRFVERWPSVEALAAAEDGELMAAWAGLGYYARARNLLACARAVVRDHGGRFPATERELRALPGIGDYTAAAIAAIAFGERAVVIDANVTRVASRLFAFAAPLPAARNALRAHVDSITPVLRSGDFAQAMMDLGSMICTPAAPACIICPLRDDCAGRTDPGRYPAKAPKPVRPERRGSIFWLEQDGQVLLQRRPETGLLGGMLGLPSSPWTDDDHGVAAAPVAGDWTSAGEVRHVFTHFVLTATVFTLRSPDRPPLADGLWHPVGTLKDAGLPTLFKRAAGIAMKGER